MRTHGSPFGRGARIEALLTELLAETRMLREALSRNPAPAANAPAQRQDGNGMGARKNGTSRRKKQKAADRRQENYYLNKYDKD